MVDVRYQIMNNEIKMSTLFEEFGRAVYYAQLLEYDLLSIWILDSITQGVSLTRDDLLEFQSSWGIKTLGGLLKPLKESPLIPEDMKHFLEKVRRDRNKLIHAFFLSDDICFESQDDMRAALNELLRIKGNLDTGRKFFRNILETYSKDFGIDIAKLSQEVKEKLTIIEQGGL